METKWTMVLRACAGSTSALATLCQDYWKVLFGFFRRKGLSREDAEDLAQNTLSELTKGGRLVAVDKSRGRFRSFLFRCATHEMAHFIRDRSAAKRGGRVITVLESEGDLIPCPEPSTNGDIFDREWSLALAARALQRVVDSYARREKLGQCRELIPFLQRAPEAGQYDDLCAKLQITHGNARVLVLRIRKEFREAMLREVLDTVGDPRQAEAELRHLLGLWIHSSSQTDRDFVTQLPDPL